MRFPLLRRYRQVIERRSTDCRVVERGPAQLVSGRDRLLQKAHQLLCLLVRQTTQHDPLRGLDRRRYAAQGSPSRTREGQLARPPVPAAFLPLHQPFEDQAVDHPGDGGAVERDQSGKGDLIDPGVGADGGERRILNGREVVTCSSNFGEEHGNRNLLEAARQMPWHFIGRIHRRLQWRVSIGSLTSILIISILINGESAMQFHLNGFEPGDPQISDPAERYPASGMQGSVPKEVDVLIVGTGPAGLTLAAQLAAFPYIKTCIVEQKPGRMLHGQADGIACRTVEMFHAFGFSERILKEACWINETTFWRPDDRQPANIARSGWVQDVEDGLSEFPHVVLNQARVHDFYLDVMRRSPAKLEPYYARRVVAVQPAASGDSDASQRASVALERLDPGHEGEVETIKARYVVGCDGARSTVRTSIGRELHGDSANHAWGVMDVLAATDFPDIRCKCLIQSAHEGNMLIIPREGGYLCRLYVELTKLEIGERVANRNFTVEKLVAKAQRIFTPYKFEAKEVPWWSVYEIGQRLTDKFDDVPEEEVASRLPSVFIAGDACHTHSPKAGQGMNVSMQDAFNLGWKLAAVLQKRCPPSLLHTYSAERRAIAKELIDFDREWSAMLASSPEDGRGPDPEETRSYFVQHGRYTAGTATHYGPSLLTGERTHQHLAKGLVVGKRFHSAPVIRLADAKPVHLGHVAETDGRFRIYAFAGAGDPTASGSDIRRLCEFLAESGQSPVRKYTRQEEDIDAVIDVRAVFQQTHRELAIEAMPALLLPRKGRYGLHDYEKMFCPDMKGGNDIFAMRGIDRDAGCVVVVRPDQYVAQVLPLDGYAQLASYFDGFMLPQMQVEDAPQTAANAAA
jgi:phenol 2-monooxygenase (NADPH)